MAAALAALDAALCDARLTRLSSLFDRFGRYVRELARGIGQPVRLVVTGGDAAIDKAIVDRLGEPLLHLIRNAVAHGIEPAGERLAAGKPAEATIALAAEDRDDRVVVTVADDGRGLALDAIVERARRLGVEVDRLDEPARRRLIFLPGLSTAARLSTLAGRGVGLDIVAGVIAGLRGVIDVTSVPGRGATFRFDLPRTLGQAAAEGPMSSERALLDAALGLAAGHLEPAVLGRLIAGGPGVTATVAAAALARQGRRALPVLHGLIGAAEPRLAALGAELLGDLGDVAAGALLRPLLDHPAAEVVRVTARALGQLRDAAAVPRLLALLEGEPRIWLAAIDALGAIGDAAAVAALARWIAEPTLTVSVARALGRIGDRAALPTLIESLIGGRSTGARIAAMIAIAEILRDQLAPRDELIALRDALTWPDGLAPFLVDVLGSPDREVARAAARLVLAAGVTRHVGDVLVRAAERDELAWTAAECARWADRIAGAVARLLASREPELLRAALICAPVAPGLADQVAMVALDRLDDTDPRVRVAACVALGRFGVLYAAPALARRITQGGAVEQIAAADALAALGPAARDALGPCFAADASLGVVGAALRVLIKVGPGRFAAQVDALLSDGRPRLRSAALQAVAAADGPEVPLRLMVAAHDADLEVARVAIELLAERGERAALPHLLRLARTAPALRPHVLPALGRLGDAITADELLADLDDPAAADRTVLATAIAEIDAPSANAAVRGWLAGDDQPLRRIAAAALARRVAPGDLTLVAALATDHDATVRYQAAWALGRLDRAIAGPLLDELSCDLDQAVAERARASCRVRGATAGRKSS